MNRERIQDKMYGQDWLDERERLINNLKHHDVQEELIKIMTNYVPFRRLVVQCMKEKWKWW